MPLEASAAMFSRSAALCWRRHSPSWMEPAWKKALAVFIAAQETQTARAFQCNDFTSEADPVLVWATAQPRRKWIALYLTLQITGDPPWGELWVWKVGQIDLEGAAITPPHNTTPPHPTPRLLLCKMREIKRQRILGNNLWFPRRDKRNAVRKQWIRLFSSRFNPIKYWITLLWFVGLQIVVSTVRAEGKWGYKVSAAAAAGWVGWGVGVGFIGGSNAPLR